MKTYPRWKIQKFVPVPGRLYWTLRAGPLWEIIYLRHEGAEPYVNLRRPTFEEAREAYVAEATGRK